MNIFYKVIDYMCPIFSAPSEVNINVSKEKIDVILTPPTPSNTPELPVEGWPNTHFGD